MRLVITAFAFALPRRYLHAERFRTAGEAAILIGRFEGSRQTHFAARGNVEFRPAACSGSEGQWMTDTYGRVRLAEAALALPPPAAAMKR